MNKEQPKISIQFPVYNKEKYLSEALDSILAQTFTDFEVICVDDFSTDASLKILCQYALRDTRIKIFTNSKNKGTLFTRKRCFEEATGNYMVFVDADDLAKPEFLQELYTAAIEHNADFVQCCADVYDPQRSLSQSVYERYQNYFSNIPKFSTSGDDVFKHLKKPIKTNLWLSTVRLDVYKAVVPHIPNVRIQHGNDNILIFLIAYFSRNYVTLQKKLYYYRANESSSNLLTPTVKIVLEHIKSRFLSPSLFKNFIQTQGKKWNSSEQPFDRIEMSALDYSLSLAVRCLEEHPEHYSEIVTCFRDTWGMGVDSKILLNLGRFAPMNVPSPELPTVCVPSKQSSNLPTVCAAGVQSLNISEPFFVRLFAFPSKILRRRREYHIVSISGLFWGGYYLQSQPGVKESDMDPLVHFMEHGWKEGRNPNPLFDIQWYWHNNPDVYSAAINPLVHFIMFGDMEGRTPSLQFNNKKYFEFHKDVERVQENSLSHYLRLGIFENRKIFY